MDKSLGYTPSPFNLFDVLHDNAQHKRRAEYLFDPPPRPSNEPGSYVPAYTFDVVNASKTFIETTGKVTKKVLFDTNISNKPPISIAMGLVGVWILLGAPTWSIDEFEQDIFPGPFFDMFSPTRLSRDGIPLKSILPSETLSEFINTLEIGPFIMEIRQKLLLLLPPEYRSYDTICDNIQISLIQHGIPTNLYRIIYSIYNIISYNISNLSSLLWSSFKWVLSLPFRALKIIAPYEYDAIIHTNELNPFIYLNIKQWIYALASYTVRFLPMIGITILLPSIARYIRFVPSLSLSQDLPQRPVPFPFFLYIDTFVLRFPLFCIKKILGYNNDDKYTMVTLTNNIYTYIINIISSLWSSLCTIASHSRYCLIIPALLYGIVTNSIKLYYTMQHKYHIEQQIDILQHTIKKITHNINTEVQYTHKIQQQQHLSSSSLPSSTSSTSSANTDTVDGTTSPIIPPPHTSIPLKALHSAHNTLLKRGHFYYAERMHDETIPNLTLTKHRHLYTHAMETLRSEAIRDYMHIYNTLPSNIDGEIQAPSSSLPPIVLGSLPSRLPNEAYTDYIRRKYRYELHAAYENNRRIGHASYEPNQRVTQLGVVPRGKTHSSVIIFDRIADIPTRSLDLSYDQTLTPAQFIRAQQQQQQQQRNSNTIHDNAAISSYHYNTNSSLTSPSSSLSPSSTPNQSGPQHITKPMMLPTEPVLILSYYPLYRTPVPSLKTNTTTKSTHNNSSHNNSGTDEFNSDTDNSDSDSDSDISDDDSSTDDSDSSDYDDTDTNSDTDTDTDTHNHHTKHSTTIITTTTQPAQPLQSLLQPIDSDEVYIEIGIESNGRPTTIIHFVGLAPIAEHCRQQTLLNKHLNTLQTSLKTLQNDAKYDMLSLDNDSGSVSHTLASLYNLIKQTHTGLTYAIKSTLYDVYNAAIDAIQLHDNTNTNTELQPIVTITKNQPLKKTSSSLSSSKQPISYSLTSPPPPQQQQPISLPRHSVLGTTAPTEHAQHHTAPIGPLAFLFRALIAIPKSLIHASFHLGVNIIYHTYQLILHVSKSCLHAVKTIPLALLYFIYDSLHAVGSVAYLLLSSMGRVIWKITRTTLMIAAFPIEIIGYFGLYKPYSILRSFAVSLYNYGSIPRAIYESIPNSIALPTVISIPLRLALYPLALLTVFIDKLISGAVYYYILFPIVVIHKIIRWVIQRIIAYSMLFDPFLKNYVFHYIELCYSALVRVVPFLGVVLPISDLFDSYASTRRETDKFITRFGPGNFAQPLLRLFIRILTRMGRTSSHFLDQLAHLTALGPAFIDGAQVDVISPFMHSIGILIQYIRIYIGKPVKLTGKILLYSLKQAAKIPYYFAIQPSFYIISSIYSMITNWERSLHIFTLIDTLETNINTTSSILSSLPQSGISTLTSLVSSLPLIGSLTASAHPMAWDYDTTTSMQHPRLVPLKPVHFSGARALMQVGGSGSPSSYLTSLLQAMAALPGFEGYIRSFLPYFSMYAPAVAFLRLSSHHTPITSQELVTTTLRDLPQYWKHDTGYDPAQFYIDYITMLRIRLIDSVLLIKTHSTLKQLEYDLIHDNIYKYDHKKATTIRTMINYLKVSSEIASPFVLTEVIMTRCTSCGITRQLSARPTSIISLPLFECTEYIPLIGLIHQQTQPRIETMVCDSCAIIIRIELGHRLIKALKQQIHKRFWGGYNEAKRLFDEQIQSGNSTSKSIIPHDPNYGTMASSNALPSSHKRVPGTLPSRQQQQSSSSSSLLSSLYRLPSDLSSFVQRQIGLTTDDNNSTDNNNNNSKQTPSSKPLPNYPILPGSSRSVAETASSNSTNTTSSSSSSNEHQSVLVSGLLTSLTLSPRPTHLKFAGYTYGRYEPLNPYMDDEVYNVLFTNRYSFEKETYAQTLIRVQYELSALQHTLLSILNPYLARLLQQQQRLLYNDYDEYYLHDNPIKRYPESIYEYLINTTINTDLLYKQQQNDKQKQHKYGNKMKKGTQEEQYRILSSSQTMFSSSAIQHNAAYHRNNDYNSASSSPSSGSDSGSDIDTDNTHQQQSRLSRHHHHSTNNNDNDDDYALASLREQSYTTDVSQSPFFTDFIIVSIVLDNNGIPTTRIKLTDPYVSSFLHHEAPYINPQSNDHICANFNATTNIIQNIVKPIVSYIPYNKFYISRIPDNIPPIIAPRTLQTTHHTQTYYTTLPKLLTIHLQRLDYHHGIKIDPSVVYPIYLDMSPSLQSLPRASLGLPSHHSIDMSLYHNAQPKTKLSQSFGPKQWNIDPSGMGAMDSIYDHESTMQSLRRRLPFMAPPVLHDAMNDQDTYIYALMAVVVHHGTQGPAQGHFVTYRRLLPSLIADSTGRHRVYQHNTPVSVPMQYINQDILEKRKKAKEKRKRAQPPAMGSNKYNDDDDDDNDDDNDDTSANNPDYDNNTYDTQYDDAIFSLPAFLAANEKNPIDAIRYSSGLRESFTFDLGQGKHRTTRERIECIQSFLALSSWYMCNEGTITQTSEASVLNNKPYMLFYERI